MKCPTFALSVVLLFFCGYGREDLLATGGNSYAYNSWLKLSSMNGGQVTLTYNGLGQLVAKTVNGVTTQYLIDDLSPTGYAQVVEEVTGGAVTRTYTYGYQRISESQPVNSIWTPSFYIYDGRGTVRQLTNSAGAVTDSYSYDAFGNLLSQSGSTPNVYLYRGERWDADLSLYYLRARWYNPATGSFMSRDPYGGNLWDPSTQHRYKYARANPVNYIDPSGRGALLEYAFNLGLNVAGTANLIYLQHLVGCLLRADAAVLNALAQPRAANEVIDKIQPDFEKCDASLTLKQLAVDTLIGVGTGMVLGEAIGGVLEWAGQGVTASSPVILDTNAVIKYDKAISLLQPGETPVITQQVLDELTNLVEQGRLDGIPNIVKQLDVIPDTVDITTQAELRSLLGQLSGNSTGPVIDLNLIQGLSGDGIIGTTGILTGAPIVTSDVAFYQALIAIGANVRFLP